MEIGSLVWVVKLAVYCANLIFARYIFPPKYKGVALAEGDERGYRHFVRLPEKGYVAGACSGMAYMFRINPWLPRMCFVGLSFGAPWFGFAIYILFWTLTDSAHVPSNFSERTNLSFSDSVRIMIGFMSRISRS
jgi:phage shock protein PspC (stress-responsive transcriptional regulator)